MDADSMTPIKLQKTDADSTPAPSTSGNPPTENAPAKGVTSKPGTGRPLTVSLQAGETPSEDMLSSSSSEELPDILFK